MTLTKLHRAIALLLTLVLALGTVTILSTDNSFAATSYVTMANAASNYKGTVPVYKDASGQTQWSSNGLKGVLSMNVYLECLDSTTNFYKVKWGSSTGYVRKTQATKYGSLPSGTTKLSVAKKETHGVYTGYLAASTYVMYTNTSTGKIKWATYCNDKLSYADETKWIVPGIATLSSL